MEAKLREYRARRRRQELIEKTTEKLTNVRRRFVDFFGNMIKINVDEAANIPDTAEKPAHDVPSKKQLEDFNKYEKDRRRCSKDSEEQSLIDINSEASEIDTEEKAPETWQHFIIKWSIYSIIWVTLYLYFLSLQFGAVFFAVSLLIGIYLNTGTRPKRRGEVSAYSVFNENCESIEGTLTPEKLQNEMMFGGFRLF